MMSTGRKRPSARCRIVKIFLERLVWLFSFTFSLLMILFPDPSGGVQDRCPQVLREAELSLRAQEDLGVGDEDSPQQG